jgi:FdhD protein
MSKAAHKHTPLELATGSYPIEVLSDGNADRQRLDDVAVEAPLEVRFAGRPATVLMRTPGNDEELVLGFLFSEGIVAGADEVASFDRPLDSSDASDGNVIDVQFADRRRRATPDRMLLSSASCGVCGKRTIESLEVRAARVESDVRVSRTVLSTLPIRLRAAQPTFALTGGVHASGLFTPDGELVALREDVGRHNALDKLIGWALAADKVPLEDSVLLLSGRVSYELVQKAVMASLPIIGAVGAPSSLAIDMARQFNVTLVGFLRANGMNVYTNTTRVGD